MKVNLFAEYSAIVHSSGLIPKTAVVSIGLHSDGSVTIFTASQPSDAFESKLMGVKRGVLLYSEVGTYKNIEEAEEFMAGVIEESKREVLL